MMPFGWRGLSHVITTRGFSEFLAYVKDALRFSGADGAVKKKQAINEFLKGIFFY